MQKTGIDYLTHTWNPIAMRCTPISPGCANCWHLTVCDNHAKNPIFSDSVRSAKAGLTPPVLYGKMLSSRPLRPEEKPYMVGLQFMGDLFHDDVPGAFVDKIWLAINDMQQHKFLLLTKRPENMLGYFTHRHSVLPNLWPGVSCENQEWADKRIPELLKIPAAVRWLSIEPLLSEINIKKYLTCGTVGVECGYEHTNKSQTSRRTGYESSQKRGNSDRPSRPDMAIQDEKRVEGQTRNNSDHHNQASPGGAHGRELSANQADVEQQTSTRHSPSASMEVFQRQNTAGFDNQPQKWEQNRQSPQELRVGDLFPADSPHAGCAEKGESVGSMGRAECDGQAHKQPSKRNQENICHRGPYPKGYRGEIRGNVSDNISNSQGGQPSQTDGTLQGLHISATAKPHISQHQRPIHFCVVGCESGPKRRPCKLEWVRDIVRQCKAASVPVFVKQIEINGKVSHDMSEWPEELRVQEYAN